jgi:restriction endonuclease Mrr
MPLRRSATTPLFAVDKRIPGRSRRHRGKQPGGRLAAEEPTQQLSPTEAITEVIDEAHSTVAGDLLARILQRPPQFLERLVLKLLVSMGATVAWRR